MKVLHLLPHLDIGGITTYVYTLSKYLMRKGVPVGIASSGGSWQEEFEQLGAKVFAVDLATKSELSPKVFMALFALDKIRKTFPFDIIHSHTRVTQVTGELYKNTRGCAHVANFHGFYRQHKRRIGRKLFKAQGTMSIAITEQVRNELITDFGARPSRVRAVLSAIDFERLNRDAPPLKLSGTLKIGSAGRLSSVKGFHYLLEAFSRVHAEYPESRLYILGEGKEEKRLLEMAKRLNVGGSFAIVKKTDLSSYLKTLDIFCYPSLEEPLGLSVLEAQYFGIPCVVSDVGGLRILVEDGKTGLRVPCADSSALAQALMRLIKDRALARTIADDGRGQVIEKFDLSKRIDEFIAVYKEALDIK